MVSLPNSGKLARRYAQYIEELQEFFDLHDLRHGAPPELGLLAAHLAGRDSFPSELASMVRSFIFREGGSMPMYDLRTLIALAVGGPAVENHADSLQHPLEDLSTFLSSVTHRPFEEHPPAAEPDEVEASPSVPQPVSSKWSSPPTFESEPEEIKHTYVQPLPSPPVLAPAVVLASPLQRKAAAPTPWMTRNRRLWSGVAVGVPILLLILFPLFHRPVASSPTSSPHVAVAAAAASPTLSTPRANLETPPATPATDLAQPTASSPANALLPLATPPPPIVSAENIASAHAVPARSKRTPRGAATSGTPSRRSASPADQSSGPNGRTSPTLAVSASRGPTADSSSSDASASAALPAPPHDPVEPASAAVTAQQGASGISSGIMSSHLLSFAPPKYPRMANLTHAEGQVILQAVVSRSGAVSSVKALSGPRTLRKAAEKAVRDWRYRPYVTDGHPADIATIVTIDIKAPQ